MSPSSPRYSAGKRVELTMPQSGQWKFERGMGRSVLVLFSGGVDSATCVAFYQGRGLGVEALFVDYGQPAALREREAAARLSEHFEVRLHRVVVRGAQCPDSGFIPGRNALLVATALASPAAPAIGLIVLGIHAGTPYPDCTPIFLAASQSLLDVYANGRVRIVAPFLTWSKGEILTYAEEAGVPLNETYSCEAGGSEPCGECRSCLDRLGLSA